MGTPAFYQVSVPWSSTFRVTFLSYFFSSSSYSSILPFQRVISPSSSCASCMSYPNTVVLWPLASAVTKSYFSSEARFATSFSVWLSLSLSYLNLPSASSEPLLSFVPPQLVGCVLFLVWCTDWRLMSGAGIVSLPSMHNVTSPDPR